MSNTPENVIHISGFGVFRGFTETNPSWEAVSRLPDHIVHNNQTILIVKHKIPVTYAAVDKKIQEIWSSKPKVNSKSDFLKFGINKFFFSLLLSFQLVIHCGVHSKANKICLEKNAFNGNFNEADFSDEFPECSKVNLPNGGVECEKLCTSLNLNNIINDIDVIAPMKCSNHPGK